MALSRRQLIAAGLGAAGAAWLLQGAASAAPCATVAPRVRCPARRAPGPLPRTFDDIFRKQCPTVPVEYLRALAKHESNLNPSETKGAAWGLLQVVESVRNDFNKRNGTSFSRQQLLDPEINTRIACQVIGERVAGRFRRLHRRAFPDGQNSFADRRFVELVTFGWNAGASESRGVGLVLGTLEKKGLRGPQITIDRVHFAAVRGEAPGVSNFLKNPAKVCFSKRVTDTYFRELRRSGGSS